MTTTGQEPVDRPDSAQGCTRWIREMLTSWDAVPAMHQVQGKLTPAQFVSLHGLAAHAHRMAAALLLIERDMVLEAMPSVRSAYECALTAHWLLRVEDSTSDFLRHSNRQRRTLLHTAKEALPGLDHSVADALASEPEHDALTAEQAARSMLERCNDLEPGGPSAYVNYRAMSALSHASHVLVDHYLDLPEHAEVPTLRRMPKPEAPDTWLHLVAASLVWAGQAVNACDAEHRRRSQLQAAARSLQVPLDLRAAPHVWVRQEQARQRQGKVARHTSAPSLARDTPPDAG